MINKKINQFLFSMIVGITVVILAGCTTDNPPTAPTNKTGLTVSVVTSTTGGNYSPKHVVAIWVENSAGTFVKTLTVYAEARKYDLTNWNSISGGNVTDATTGATQSNFGTIYGSWNGTDSKGVAVPDGTYRLCMELTDKGSTGNFSYFTFTKGTVAESQTPSNVPSFSTITIKWVPL